MRLNNTKKLFTQIQALGNESVFIANDFTDISDYETIRKALNRLAEKGRLQKILRGVYFCSNFSNFLQEYEAPSPHEVASGKFTLVMSAQCFHYFIIAKCQYNNICNFVVYHTMNNCSNPD